MKNLVPRFIHDQYQAGRRRGQFKAASLFVDISGFTALTETLMQRRQDGAEVLTGTLNRIFAPIVHEVYARSGFIAAFAGDAFTAVFPLRRNAKRADSQAAQTALFTQQFFAQNGKAQTKYGNFELGVRAGLGVGEVRWGILGQAGRYTYYFRGPAIDQCIEAERCAETGDVIATQDVAGVLGSQAVWTPHGTQFKLLGINGAPPIKKIRLKTLERESLQPFVLDAAIDLVASGVGAEFRQVVPVFISFDAPDDSDGLNAFVAAVLERAAGYGGYFNKLDFGDKGPIMLILFGAPVAHENDPVRAANFLMALQDQARPVRWRAGLAFGLVYAGVMGGVEQSEYTVIGDVVNTASRLTQAAEWSQIWISKPAADALHNLCEAAPLGELAIRGKSEAVPVYELALCHTTAEDMLPCTSAMISRENELARLIELIQPVFEGRFAGMVYVYGEAGIGKSRLVHELRQRLTHPQPPPSPERQEREGMRLSWFVCPAEETLRQSLNPFKYFLRHYLGQSPDCSPEQNKARFAHVLDVLAADVRASAKPGAAELADEMERTQPFLGALVDLHWEGSLYEQVEPKLRFENTLTAFKTLMQMESLRQPVVVQLEDVHWLDADSHELIKVLTRNMAGYPVAIICTSRYRDDGSQLTLAIAADVPQRAVELNVLAPESIQVMASQLLGGLVAEGLVHVLVEKTDGNPFFIEQLILDPLVST